MDEDLEKIVQVWAAQCGPHDFGCSCAPGDFRPVVLELARQLQNARDKHQEVLNLIRGTAMMSPEMSARIEAFLSDPSTGVRRERPARRQEGTA